MPHRVHAHRLDMELDRTLGFFSSRPNWNPPPPHPQASVPPLLWFREWGDGVKHSLAGGGDRGGPNSDEEGTDTVVLLVCMYFVHSLFTAQKCS
jgi:hypothetical protein